MSNLDLKVLLQLVDKASKPLNSFMKNTQQTDSALDRLIASVDRLDNTLNNNGGLNNYSRGLKQVRTEASLTQQSLGVLGTGLKTAWTAFDTAHNKIEQFRKKLADSRAEMRQQFKSIAIGTGIAGMGFYQMLKPAIEFEQQMSRVQAVMGLDKLSKDMQELTKSARDWGAASSFSPKEAAQAQHALASAGFNTKQVLDALGGTLQLAEAGQIELAQSAQIAAGTLNGFGLEAKEITRVNDVLLKATDLTATSVDGFGETMKYVAPIARAYGADIEQTSAMIGLLGQNTILDSQAGTSLRAIMTRFAAPPKEALKTLDKLKISVTDKKGDLREMADILEEVNKKTKNMGSAARLEIFKDLAGQEAISAFATLVDQAAVIDKTTGKTVNNIKQLTDQLRKSEGAAAKAAAILKDNLGGDIEQLGGSLQDLSVSLLNALGGDLRGAVTGLTEFIDKIKQWVEANPELVRRIADLLIKLLMLKVALLSMKYGFNLFLSGVVSIFAGITKLGIAAFITSAILAKFGIGFWGRMGLLARGFGMLARGAMFLAVRALPLVMMGLRMLAVSMLTNPIFLIGTAIALVARLIIKYWSPISAFFAGFAQGLMQGLAPAIDRFKQIWQSLLPAFEPLIPIFQTIGNVFSWLTDIVLSFFQPLNATKSELDSAKSAGQSFGSMLGTVIGFIADSILVLTQFSLETLKIGEVWKFAGEFIAFTIRLIFSLIEGLALIVTSLGSLIVATVKGIVDAFIWLGTAIGTMAGFIVVNFSKVPVFFSTTWQTIQTLFSSAIAAISNIINSFHPIIFFQNAFAAVFAFFTSLPERFASIGSQIIDGLIRGINNKIANLKATFSNVMSSLPSWAKSVLDIHSPSRVFEQIGNFTMQGLANGINGSAAQPLAATANVASKLPQQTAKVQPVKPIQRSGGTTIISQDKIDYHISVSGNSPVKQIVAELDARDKAKTAAMQRSFKSYRDQE